MSAVIHSDRGRNDDRDKTVTDNDRDIDSDRDSDKDRDRNNDRDRDSVRDEETSPTSRSLDCERSVWMSNAMSSSFSSFTTDLLPRLALDLTPHTIHI